MKYFPSELEQYLDWIVFQFVPGLFAVPNHNNIVIISHIILVTVVCIMIIQGLNRAIF